jgi:hypothetical protein
MGFSFGNGGWVKVDSPDRPGPLYVRLSPHPADGRWVVTELYLDGGGHPITGAMLRKLPISYIEGALQDDDEARQHLADRSKVVSPDLSTAASYYATTVGSRATGWVADMLRSQVAGSVRRQPGRQLGRRKVPPLQRPQDGLTDDFLRHVARNYAAAVRRGDAPALALAAQADVPAQTVRRWVYLARQRGIMPPGRQGRAG